MPTPQRPHQPTHRHPTAAPIPGARLGDAVLFTPEEAAQRLRVRPSWLRKKAAARDIPCTFLGKHLRFSPTDLDTIITISARPAIGRRNRRKSASPTVGDRDLTGPLQGSVDPRRDDHTSDGSSRWPG